MYQMEERFLKRTMKNVVQLLPRRIVHWFVILLPLLSINAFVGTSSRYLFMSARTLSWKATKIFLQPNEDRAPMDINDEEDNTSLAPRALVESFLEVSMSLTGDEAKTQDLKSVQKSLVRNGLYFDVYRRSLKLSDSIECGEDNRVVLSSGIDRVPGCVASVHVQTVLVPSSGVIMNQKDSKRYKVWLNGTADAMLSRGLLASLSQAVSGTTIKERQDDNSYFINESKTTWMVSAHDVLQIKPESVSELLRLEHVLSKGRNDGLASIMRIVQGQIRNLLYGDDSNDNDSAHGHQYEESVIPSTISRDAHSTSDKRRRSVAMLLSGGVDSSVALNLLKRQGYNVTAFYLKIWLEDELAHLGQCPWEDDYQACLQVCQQAQVPLETISLQEEYKDRVIAYTVKEARRGRTPNPDVMCNSRVKFGCFYDAIANRGFDHVASGHYAQLVEGDKNRDLQRLLRAPDPIKDQSYFLCVLTQEQLKRILFPIGHLHKSEVRQLAHDFNLPNQHRPDSQGLCFLGKVKFDEFLSAYLGDCPGPILDAATEEVLGQHRGVWYHTVGQRKGIGKVLNPKATSRGPWYVVAKDPERKIVFVSNKYEEEVFTAARSQFYVEDLQWIRGEVPLEFFQHMTRSDVSSVPAGRFLFKIRHGPTLASGTLELDDEKGCGGNVRLEDKDGGLAPGQFVALYAKESNECLGGGVISERHWTKFLLNQGSIVRQDLVTQNTS